MEKANLEELRNELSMAGSSLAVNKRGGGFPVPDNYFETLPGIIQGRLVRKKSPMRQFMMLIAAHKLAAAFVAVLILLSLTAGLFMLVPGKGNDLFAEMDESEFLSVYAALDSYYLYDMAVASGLNGDGSISVPGYESEELEEEVFNEYFYQLIEHYSLDPEYFQVSGN